MRSALSANGARAKFSVAEAVQSTVLSLPEDFDLTEQQAQALQSDDVIPAPHWTLASSTAARALQRHATPRPNAGDRPAANARHLVWFLVLVLLAGMGLMGLSDNRRAPFVYYTAGNFADGPPWREPLPAYLTDRHVAVLVTLIGVVKTPVPPSADIHRRDAANANAGRQSASNLVDRGAEARAA
jgi:hypothetical protein